MIPNGKRNQKRLISDEKKWSNKGTQTRIAATNVPKISKIDNIKRFIAMDFSAAITIAISYLREAIIETIETIAI
jgi:hypothetical protein